MARSKNKRRHVSKKKYLLSSKKCWLIEDVLLPVYSHLVESYSDQLKDTWEVKVEESQFGSVQIKEEPSDEINYDAPMILPINEVCINFPPLTSFYKRKHFAFIIFHSLVFPFKNVFLLPGSIINILMACRTGEISVRQNSGSEEEVD